MQLDFTCTACRVCGFVYAKGKEEDDKLHAAFHDTALHGITFQVRSQPKDMRQRFLVFLAVQTELCQDRAGSMSALSKLTATSTGSYWYSQKTQKSTQARYVYPASANESALSSQGTHDHSGCAHLTCVSNYCSHSGSHGCSRCKRYVARLRISLACARAGC